MAKESDHGENHLLSTLEPRDNVRTDGRFSLGIIHRILKLDRYNQIVLPLLPRRFVPWWLTGNRGTNLSEEIVRQGWAFVYESAGGIFPHPEKKEGYMKLMNEAQYATISLFSLSPFTRFPLKGRRKLGCGSTGLHWRHRDSTRNGQSKEFHPSPLRVLRKRARKSRGFNESSRVFLDDASWDVCTSHRNVRGARRNGEKP